MDYIPVKAIIESDFKDDYRVTIKLSKFMR